MIVIDTSVWLDLYRTATSSAKDRLAQTIGSDLVVFAPFVVTELLQGARNEAEWDALSQEIAKFSTLELSAQTWTSAARIFFDLQRQSITVRSTVDCLIAQLCLESTATLIHNDRDFDRIATIRPLNHIRLDLSV